MVVLCTTSIGNGIPKLESDSGGAVDGTESCIVSLHLLGIPGLILVDLCRTSLGSLSLKAYFLMKPLQEKGNTDD